MPSPYAATPLDNLIGVAVDTFKSGNWPINGLRHPLEAGQSIGWYIWAGMWGNMPNYLFAFDNFYYEEVCKEYYNCDLVPDFLAASLPQWAF